MLVPDFSLIELGIEAMTWLHAYSMFCSDLVRGAGYVLAAYLSQVLF